MRKNRIENALLRFNAKKAQQQSGNKTIPAVQYMPDSLKFKKKENSG